MAKDPAFLFYTSDFLTGVIDMSMKERGQYITLICLQHQRGHLTMREMVKVAGKLSPEVLSKFANDDEGLFYNIRADAEIQKRDAHCQKQREKVSKRWNSQKPCEDNTTEDKKECRGNTVVLPLENENENNIQSLDYRALKENGNVEVTGDRVQRKNPPKHRYGEYDNVLLSEADMDKLRMEFPGDWQKRIEKLSEYMASSGKSYKNHLATIRNWARRDAEKTVRPVQSTSNPFLDMLIEEGKA